MDKAQVKILIMVLIGVLYFGQALYSYFKKQTKQTVSRPKPRQNVHRTVPQPAPRPQSATYASHKSVSASPFLEGEKHACVSSPDLKACPADSHSSPPETATDGSPSPFADETTLTGDPHEELRRAVIWSEILQRKF